MTEFRLQTKGFVINFKTLQEQEKKKRRIIKGNYLSISSQYLAVPRLPEPFRLLFQRALASDSSDPHEKMQGERIPVWNDSSSETRCVEQPAYFTRS